MKLWGYLRTRPMGYKFRRQHPIGIYIVDFYCHALKLVIEADGLQVIRFTNNEILKNTEHVTEQINIILTEKSIPPSGG